MAEKDTRTHLHTVPEGIVEEREMFNPRPEEFPERMLSIHTFLNGEELVIDEDTTIRTIRSRMEEDVIIITERNFAKKPIPGIGNFVTIHKLQVNTAENKSVKFGAFISQGFEADIITPQNEIVKSIVEEPEDDPNFVRSQRGDQTYQAQTIEMFLNAMETMRERLRLNELSDEKPPAKDVSHTIVDFTERTQKNPPIQR